MSRSHATAGVTASPARTSEARTPYARRSGRQIRAQAREHVASAAARQHGPCGAERASMLLEAVEGQKFPQRTARVLSAHPPIRRKLHATPGRASTLRFGARDMPKLEKFQSGDGVGDTRWRFVTQPPEPTTIPATQTPAREDFHFSPEREPHALRAREILRRHAEIRSLAGRNAWSALLVACLVVLQTSARRARVRTCRSGPRSLAAFFVGAFLDHTLWVLIHECSHNLVFRRASWNRIAAIAANLPHILPSAISFQTYHLKHHAFQGVYELDADIPSRWEARLVGHSALRKALWLLLFPVFQVTRPPRLREIPLFGPWVFANIGAQLAYDVAVWMLLGPEGFPLSRGLVLLLGRPAPARSALDPGALPRVRRAGDVELLRAAERRRAERRPPQRAPRLSVRPWNRLPAIRRAVPEVYDALSSHRSWTRLLVRFIFDRRLSLFSRTIRSERGLKAVPRAARPQPEISAGTGPARIPDDFDPGGLWLLKRREVARGGGRTGWTPVSRPPSA